MSDPSDFLEDPDPPEPETSPEELPPAKAELMSFAASLIAEAAVRAEPRPAAPQPVAVEPPPAAGLGIPAALPVVTDISTAEASLGQVIDERRVLELPQFADGKVDTTFIERVLLPKNGG